MGTERSISAVWMVYSMSVGSSEDEPGAQLCLLISVPSGLSQGGNSRVLLVFKYLSLSYNVISKPNPAILLGILLKKQ